MSHTVRRAQCDVPVQFKGVGAVSVCGFLLQVAGQVDDRQRSKRAFLQRQSNRITKTTTKKPNRLWWFAPCCRCYYLDADATAYTQRLWDPHDLTLWSHLDTQLTCKHTHKHTLMLCVEVCLDVNNNRTCTHPYGRPGSSSCTPDGISWVCICHGWRWRSWCFYPPWWRAGMMGASTSGAEGHQKIIKRTRYLHSQSWERQR